MKGDIMHKTNKDIAQEWDRIAYFRLQQLEDGKDSSMDRIIMPMLLDLSNNLNFNNVIDVGCGVGYVTKKIAKISEKIIGIDISEDSIRKAQFNNTIDKIEFKNISIENFALKTNKSFTLAIANMLLMDVANLENVIKSINSILINDGYLIITMTHPYFWPFYWNYANELWFEYNKEIEIEDKFRISNSNTEFITTHFHRPLHIYLNILIDNHFVIEKISEPYPSDELNDQYPSKWKFPRFIGIKCRKKD